MHRYSAHALSKTGATRSTDQPHDSLYATSPEQAARKWLYRLSVEERMRCVSITVGPWVRRPCAGDAYEGEEITFEVKEGKLQR
jgi:hypothetical protein